MKLCKKNFYDFLKSDDMIAYFDNDDNAKHLIQKVSYNKKLDVLYMLYNYTKNPIDLTSKMEYVGVYDKENDNLYGLIYSLSWYIKDLDKNEITGLNKIAEQMNKDINDRIFEIVQNSKDLFDFEKFNLSKSNLLPLELKDAYGYFLDGETSDTFNARLVTYNSSNSSDILNYLTNKEELVETEARKFVSENSERILIDLYRGQEYVNLLKNIEEHPENLIHKTKEILEAVHDKGYKTVNITINKNNEEQTFKYDVDCIRCFNDFDLSIRGFTNASERKAFEEKCGKWCSFSYKDIVKITYGKNVIYEDLNFDKKLEEENVLER